MLPPLTFVIRKRLNMSETDSAKMPRSVRLFSILLACLAGLACFRLLNFHFSTRSAKAALVDIQKFNQVNNHTFNYISQDLARFYDKHKKQLELPAEDELNRKLYSFKYNYRKSDQFYSARESIKNFEAIKEKAGQNPQRANLILQFKFKTPPVPQNSLEFENLFSGFSSRIKNFHSANPDESRLNHELNNNSQKKQNSADKNSPAYVEFEQKFRIKSNPDAFPQEIEYHFRSNYDPATNIYQLSISVQEHTL